MNLYVTLLVAVLASSTLTVVTQKLLNGRAYDASVALTDANTADIISQASERAINMVVTQLQQAQSRIALLEQMLVDANGRITVLEARLLKRRVDDKGVVIDDPDVPLPEGLS